MVLRRLTIFSRQTLKLGLASATLQQRNMSWCKAGGQFRDLGNLPPARTWCNTSIFVLAGYGCCPKDVISHINTPNAQTSLCEVNTPSTNDSGAIHRTGSNPSPSCNKRLNICFCFISRSQIVITLELGRYLLFDNNRSYIYLWPVQSHRS